MASLLTKLDPRNINWRKSPHKVTPEISAKNDAKIDELEKEQKLLASKLKRGVYKSDADFKQAWKAQNRSFQRILDHRDAWDETTSKHPRVNKQREIEKDRFMGNAIAIQNKYDNVISKQAQKQGVCGYLSKKTCNKGKDCYWFGKEDVDGKDVGCYSKKEPRKYWGEMKPAKTSKATTLGTIQENPVAAMQHAIKQKLNEEKKKTKSTYPPRPSSYPPRPSSSYPDRSWGGKKKTKRRKRKRKRKKTRRKRKRRTKRRTKRRKR